MSAGTPVAIANVVVVGDRWSERVELFVPVPGAEAANRRLAALTRRLEVGPARDITTAAELRKALARLPCCVTVASTDDIEPPLNLVLIGRLDDVAAAFALRGYHYREPGEWRVHGREADLAAMKTSRWRAPKPLVVRVWATSLRFRGEPVLIGQIGEAEGGRFAVRGPDADAIHHLTDPARDALIQDLAYSQSVERLGFVTGAVAPTTSTPYRTDALRAVLVFGSDPQSLAEIEFFDWERLADYR
jgi:hypothetical protein